MSSTTNAGSTLPRSALARSGAAVTIARMSIARRGLLAFLLLLAATFILASIGPLDLVLGTSARVVYLHGAWVWSA